MVRFVRSILAFLGFGRSARLGRMVRKAHARTLRAYGPTFGFYPDSIRHFNPTGWILSTDNADGFGPFPVGDAGNVREILYMGHGADFGSRWTKVPPLP